MQLLDLLAKLSKLSLSGEEKKRLEKHFPAIIEYISQVKNLDTSGVEPTFHTNITKTVLRKDVSRHDRVLSSSVATQNARRKQDGYFVVDAVL